MTPWQKGFRLYQQARNHQYGFGGIRRDRALSRSLYAKAAVEFRKAASHGVAVAQLYLGICLLNGLGVPRDGAQALMWFSKAAQGRGGVAKNAFLQIGLMYLNGTAIRKDPAKAVTWFRKGVRRGSGDCNQYLAFCYLKGKGVEKDATRADRMLKQPGHRTTRK